MTAAVADPSSWQARLRLELRAGEDRTRLIPRERFGPLSVQRPFYPEGDCCHVYILHPPGGVVGGDGLELQADLDSGAGALFTNPGAGKFYSSDGAEARVEQRFAVAGGASFEFLPQANIYFPGARVRMHTRLDIESDGRAVLWEKHCFGRPANRETFSHGRLQSKIDLHAGGQLVFTETQRVDAAELQRASGFRGHAVSGSLLVFGATIDTGILRELQQLSPLTGHGGVSEPQPGLLVARYLGDDGAALDAYFIRLWERLRPPLIRRAACHPRIWNT